ncbi:MAG TPA: nuclear transport factor 2 family protein [Pyrinomonadaceae bacterium]|nr:nuclear transport factor 2 family protein [Pyrinomonadaceae bacterium]
MKRIIVLVVIITMTSLASGQTADKHVSSGSAAGQELLELDRKFVEAYIRNDTAFLDSIFSDDVTIINTQGKVLTKDEALKMRFAPAPGVTYDVSNPVDEVSVHLYGETAIVTGRTTLKATRKGKTFTIPGRYTRVYVKLQGRWRIVAFHANNISQEKEKAQ